MNPRYDAFVSYSRTDDAVFRDKLRAGLAQAGVTLWFDRDALPNRGDTFDQEIRRAIESSARLLLIVEPAALTSSYVPQEWGFADDLGMPVIPVLRTGTFDDVPKPLSSYHTVDARPPRSTEDILGELRRLLSDPPQPLATLHLVPAAQANELPRTDLLDSLATTLGIDRQRPQDAGRSERAAALYGLSGSGKSTVAAAFARTTRTRRAFRDGIAWISCWPTFDPLSSARTLLERVAAGARLPTSTLEIPDALRAGLATRELLIILDDVRDPNAVAAFTGALGPGGRTLITTLDQAVASALGATEIPVDQLDAAASRRLLEIWAGDTLPAQADEVVEACEGLPFALALVGAMAHNRVPWVRILQAFQARRLDLIAARFPTYPHPNLLKAMGAAYDALLIDDPLTAKCYLQLAALRPGALLSEAAMIRLWSRASGIGELDASLVAPVLERRLLLRRRATPRGERFSLHGLHEDFVRLECKDAPALERNFVDSYRSDRRGEDWSSLEDDGYVFDYLTAHLASLDARDDLIAALNTAWIRRQLARTGDLAQPLGDLRLALEVATRAPLDVVAVARFGLLMGRVKATLRQSSPNLIAALAECGQHDAALRWAAEKPDPAQRFDALCHVAEVLVERGETATARKIVTSAVQTIPQLGGVVETGMFDSLTALNAVHMLVHFPFPDQWEGTNEQLVAMARVPLDALVRLAPIAERVGAVAELGSVSHPFWDLYGHLIPLVAAEQLAEDEHVELAAALLASSQHAYDADSDMAHAAQYRHAVALAAIGQFTAARMAVDKLPGSYASVGYRGLAKHFARAARADDALAVLALIDDESVANAAVTEVIEATIDLADSAACRTIADYAIKRDWLVAGLWVLAAGGEPEMGLGMIERAPRDDLRIALGTRLGLILLSAKKTQQARDVAAQLLPAAERLSGPQWFAPETLAIEANQAALGNDLLRLIALSGHPLPPTTIALALTCEAAYTRLPHFKLPLIVSLALTGRLDEVFELAETSSIPGGAALGLATALSVADGGADREAIDAAVTRLVALLEEAQLTTDLDASLGAVMRRLTMHEPGQSAQQLAAVLLHLHPLCSAVGIWLQHRAKQGDAKAAHEQIYRSLVEAPLQTANPQSRASLMSALAARDRDRREHVAAATALLADPRVAASTLDVVFEVVSLESRDGMEAGEAIANGIATGKAADIVRRLLQESEVRWDDGTSVFDIAAAAVARAVAATAMALADALRGDEARAKHRIEQVHSLSGLAERCVPDAGIADALAKYLGAASVAVDPQAHTGMDNATLRDTALLLWNSGRTELAVALATAALPAIEAFPKGGGQVISTPEEFQRRNGLAESARAILQCILAMNSATAQDWRAASAAALDAKQQTRGYGWSALSLAERSSVDASVAIALQQARCVDEAMQQFERACEPALTLARRGEMFPFNRLCEALVTLSPKGANEIWSEWLIAAAEGGASEALILIADYLRWRRDIATDAFAMDPQSGELVARAPPRNH